MDSLNLSECEMCSPFVLFKYLGYVYEIETDGRPRIFFCVVSGFLKLTSLCNSIGIPRHRRQCIANRIVAITKRNTIYKRTQDGHFDEYNAI